MTVSPSIPFPLVKTSWRVRALTAGALLLAAASVTVALGREAHASPEAVSISERIAAAQPGDTIIVSAGTYREQLVIDRPVTLIGEGWPVVDASEAGDVVLVTAPDVTLRGFVIQGSAQGVIDEPAAIRVRGDRSIIEGNRIRECLYGIMIEDSNGHRIVGNEVSSIREFSPERRGHALSLWHTDDNLVADNVVDGSKDGVFVGFSTRNRVERNRIRDARYGIHYMYADHNTFVDNTFRESVAGAAIMFSRDITFRGNEFALNRSAASGYGLLFKDVDDVEMTENRVIGNRLGVQLEGAPHTPGATVTMRHNLVGWNDTALELASTTRVTFVENTFVGNLAQVTLSGGDTLHKNTWGDGERGNYWDDYRGYDANGDGIGDIAYQYEGTFDQLVQQSEWVRAYSFTPARTALEMAADWFPRFRPEPRVVDPHPLMRPAMSMPANAGTSSRVTTLAMAGALCLGPLAGWFGLMRSRGARW